MAINTGTLYVAATPIGNLADITIRALEVLKKSDLIISEDTRETRILLDHYNIKAKQISYRDQNHEKVFLSILNDLLHGQNITLVSDSGTPGISDPGFKLVRDLRKNSFTNILAVPGPSAIISALSIAGLPTDKFCFLGFLSKKLQDRQKELEKVKNFEGTLVLYESPQRLQTLLSQLQETLGDRYAVLCSELTKINENVEQGCLSKLSENLKETSIRGEYVVLVAKEGFSYE